jgi:hypothetical protein
LYNSCQWFDRFAGSCIAEKAYCPAFDKGQFLTLDYVIWDLACEKTKKPGPRGRNA